MTTSFSLVSLWELTIKVRAGKLDLDVVELAREAERIGFTRLGLAPERIAVVRSFEVFPKHRDPFDHMLIAQAVALAAAIISSDRRFADYPVEVIAP